MEKEIWEKIIGFEDYEVSNFGNVKSLKFGKEKILKKSLDAWGYLRVCLLKFGKKHTKRIHQLVAINFLNHRPCKMVLVVDHINNDKLNNNAKNLQLITNQKNVSKDRTQKSGYTGVYNNGKKWFSIIQINNERIYLGTFETKEDASNAYKEKKEI